MTNTLNTLRPRQNRRHFADDIFKCIFLNDNIWIPIKISLKFVPKGSITNIPALVQIMAWRHPGDKPLSEPMMINLPTHICVTRPQWVKPREMGQQWSFFIMIHPPSLFIEELIFNARSSGNLWMNTLYQVLWYCYVVTLFFSKYNKHSMSRPCGWDLGKFGWL